MKTLFGAVFASLLVMSTAFAGSSTDPATIGGGAGHYPTGQEPSGSNHSNMTVYQTLTCQGCHQGNTSQSNPAHTGNSGHHDSSD